MDVGWKMGVGAPDEGFHGGNGDIFWRSVGHGSSCFREFVSGLVAWYTFVTGGTNEDGGAFPVAYSP